MGGSSSELERVSSLSSCVLRGVLEGQMCREEIEQGSALSVGDVIRNQGNSAQKVR